MFVNVGYLECVLPGHLARDAIHQEDFKEKCIFLTFQSRLKNGLFGSNSIPDVFHVVPFVGPLVSYFRVGFLIVVFIIS